jgi:hypothetical protein
MASSKLLLAAVNESVAVSCELQNPRHQEIADDRQRHPHNIPGERKNILALQ